MRVLVTGGGGYLGCVLVKQLVRARCRVRVLDRFFGSDALLRTRWARPGDQRFVQVHIGDVRDPLAVREAIDGCAVVIHLAGIVGYPACDADPEGSASINVEGTRVVREAADRIGARIFFPSTGSVYGKLDAGVTIATEDLVLRPTTYYGRQKAEAEQIVRSANRGTVFRLATLYGPSLGMRWDLLPHNFLVRALEGTLEVYQPDAVRHFLHVEEAARVFVLAAQGWVGGGGRVYNVGTATGAWTKGDVAAAVGAAVTQAGGYVTLRALTGKTDPEFRDYQMDYRKLEEEGVPGQLGHGTYALPKTLAQLVTPARQRRALLSGGRA